jgi:predicted TIM-barrel fold metal-dependent hydrolase
MDPKLRVTFPPDPNPRKPRLVAPPGSWDTHFHVYAPHLFPFAEKRRYTPPAAPVEHYLQINSAIGLQRGVIVQPSVHGTNTAVTVDAVAKSEGRLVGMIRSDPELTAEDVKRLHAAGVRGLRFPISRDLGNSLKEEVFHHNVALMEKTRWVVDMQIDSDVMVAKADMIRRCTLPVVIDTWGRIDPRCLCQNSRHQSLSGAGRPLPRHDQSRQGAHRRRARSYSLGHRLAAFRDIPAE